MLGNKSGSAHNHDDCVLEYREALTRPATSELCTTGIVTEADLAPERSTRL